MKANKLTYQERYSDGSGVEFEVTYSDEEYIHDKNIKGVINITHLDDVTFPITKIHWLIECLERIRDNVNPTNE